MHKHLADSKECLKYRNYYCLESFVMAGPQCSGLCSGPFGRKYLCQGCFLNEVEATGLFEDAAPRSGVQSGSCVMCNFYHWGF